MSEFSSLNEEPKGKVQMGHGGRYKLPHPITGKETLFTRVSTIAHTIIDTYHLDMWQYRMVARGMAIWPELSQAASGLDISKDKARLQALATAAKEAAGLRFSTGIYKANLGSALHACTQLYESGMELNEDEIAAIIADIVSDYRTSLINDGLDKYGLFLDTLVQQMSKAMHKRLTLDMVMADVLAYTAELENKHIELDPYLTERVVINMEYEIVGRVDRVGRSRFWPKPRICDLKTGGVDYDGTAFIVQTALYANADYMWNEITAEWEPFPDIDKSVAQIIHLPVGEKSCEIHNSPIDLGWQCVRLAMNVRKARKHGKEALSPYVDDYVWRARIESATSVQELSAIWLDAKHLGQWTKTLEQLGMKKREELTCE